MHLDSVNYPINSKITRGLNFFFLPKIAGYFRVRIEFFFFLWLETNAYSSIKKSSSWWFSAAINWLSAVVRVSKYSKSLSQNSDKLANASSAFSSFFMQWISSTFALIHETFADYYRVRIKFECGLIFFFFSKIADWIRVRIIIECGLFSS